MTALTVVTDDGLRYHWYEIVNQDQIWVDRQGVEHRIADMDAGYKANALAFLIRNHAGRLHRLAIGLRWARIIGSEYSAWVTAEADEEFNAFLDTSPEEYLRGTPLGRALAA